MRGNGVRTAAATPWLLSAVLAAAYGPAILNSDLLQGDLPGHLEMMRWSAEHLWPLPWGWDPRYLCGAPIGILYPPLLAWVGGAVGQWVAVEWALRLVLWIAVAGLPPALWYAARGLGLRRREALWATAAGVAILWLPGRGLGGSLHQTLVSGNAANGLVLPIFLLFSGRLRQSLCRPGRIAGTAALLAVTLLGHMLLGAVAGVTLVAYAGMMASKRGTVALGRGAAIAGLALAGAAPFLLPFVVHLRDASPDAIAFSPLPTLPEWIALAVLTALIVAGGRPARSGLLPALALLWMLYLCRGVLFPVFGAPDVRMEYHRFRLFLYLALAPASALAMRRTLFRRPVGRYSIAGAVALVVLLSLFARFDARGPRPVAMPASFPDVAGRRLLVLASPDVQNGSWHGLQLRLPRSFGGVGLKGLFVESSPVSRRMFELERLAASDGARPRWWAIRIASRDEIRSWSLAESRRRFVELGVAGIVAREPVSDTVHALAVEPPSDLGEGFRAYRLPDVPLARPIGGDGRSEIEIDISDDGAAMTLGLPPDGGRAILAISAFPDWRVARGEATVGREPPGLLTVTGRGEVELRYAPRAEEWAGLALGWVGFGSMIGLARRARRRGPGSRRRSWRRRPDSNR